MVSNDSISKTEEISADVLGPGLVLVAAQSGFFLASRVSCKH